MDMDPAERGGVEWVSDCCPVKGSTSHTPSLNAIRPAVCEIWKRGVHVRTCRCTPPQTCVKHLYNGSLVTHKI